jgi:GrpB-like predicted nucleotidyltransferase (UPF0157 family)/8-oxo-dGTP pyrophosphatase MutT (NUDIX family)
MQADRPHTISASSGRTFATFPAAVVVPIVNRREELLLLESQRRPGLWEPVNGAVEDGETLFEAALREVREEAGPDLRVRPIGVVHASTFAYDAHVPRMISVTYLMAHEGGAVVPGDDMRGSRVRWATLSAVQSDGLRLLPPLDQAWLRRRTLELYRLWEQQPAVMLQESLRASARSASVDAHDTSRWAVEPVRIVPYDVSWPELFLEERAVLSAAIGDWAVGGIHHVGGTVVPGLEAKPVIDILVGVQDLATSRDCFGRLAALGYVYAPYRADEMHWFCKPDPARRTHHLHLVPTGSPRFRNELAFRDYLCGHADVARDYGALKRRLAKEFEHDREGYTAAKADFVRAALDRARTGAS